MIEVTELGDKERRFIPVYQGSTCDALPEVEIESLNDGSVWPGYRFGWMVNRIESAMYQTKICEYCGRKYNGQYYPPLCEGCGAPL